MSSLLIESLRTIKGWQEGEVNGFKAKLLVNYAPCKDVASTLRWLKNKKRAFDVSVELTKEDKEKTVKLTVTEIKRFWDFKEGKAVDESDEFAWLLWRWKWIEFKSSTELEFFYRQAGANKIEEFRLKESKIKLGMTINHKGFAFPFSVWLSEQDESPKVVACYVREFLISKELAKRLLLTATGGLSVKEFYERAKNSDLGEFLSLTQGPMEAIRLLVRNVEPFLAEEVKRKYGWNYEELGLELQP